MVYQPFEMYNLEVKQGFTLIELLIVVAIFLFAAAMTPSFFGNWLARQTLDEEVDQLVQNFHLARERALTGWHGDNQGICFKSTPDFDSYILYHGASCAARVVADDQEVKLPSSIRLSDTWTDSDLNFNTTGVPQAPGAATLAHEVYGERVVEVNQLGLTITP